MKTAIKEFELDPKTMSAPGLKAFFGIADQWGLTNDEQRTLLGNPPRSTFFKWKKQPGEIPVDALERISHVLAIYKNLRILLPSQDRSNAWIRKPNKADFLEGKPALHHMLNGKMADIIDVRQYLDAERGGWA